MTLTGIDRWVLPTYHKHFLNYETRFIVMYGGAGSGKSHFIAQKLIIKALRMQRKILVIRKVGSTIKDSTFASFTGILSQMPQVIKQINKTDSTITLINGSVMLFKGLDNTEKIKSIVGITDIFIEEATELTLEDFSQLNLRLRSKQPYNQIHIAFNPVSKSNWVYKYFFEHGTPDNTIIYQTTYKDNPHLPKEYTDSLMELEARNPTYFKIYVLGEFATLDKLVYPIVTKRIINKDETKGLLFWCGMDFGYVADPTAINWGYFNPANKTLYITGEYHKKEMTNDVIAKTIIDLGLAKERIVADSAEPKSISEIKRMGVSRIIGAAKGKDSVMNGIDKISRCDIIVDERCVQTIEEFENYTWIKDWQSGEYINEPIDCYNHHMDAIRYGIQAVYGKRLYSDEELRSHWML